MSIWKYAAYLEISSHRLKIFGMYIERVWNFSLFIQ